MNLISKQNELYKGLRENGYTDFPNINVRVLYYKDIDDGGEYAISINLNNKNKILDIEQFHKFNFETLSS